MARVEDPNAIAHGAECLWWDSASKAVVGDDGLPRCPRCGSVLYSSTVEEWNRGVKLENELQNGYKEMVEWSRGKCFDSYNDLMEAYSKSGHSLPTPTEKYFRLLQREEATKAVADAVEDYFFNRPLVSRQTHSENNPAVFRVILPRSVQKILIELNTLRRAVGGRNVENTLIQGSCLKRVFELLEEIT